MKQYITKESLKKGPLDEPVKTESYTSRVAPPGDGAALFL